MPVKRLKKTDKLGATRYKLPTKKSDPPESLWDLCMCLYGTKGIGKTSLTALFPGALNFQWEALRRNIRMLTIPEPGQPALDWPTFRGYRDLILGMPKEERPRTIVIDTVDNAYEACLKTVTQENYGVDHPQDPSLSNLYGMPWTHVKVEFRTTMDALRNACCIVFISHQREREVDGSDIMQLTPTCSPACWTYLKGATDVAWYYGYKGRERVLVLQGSEDVWASCQVDDHFLHPETDEPLAMINMGHTAQDAIDRLGLAWENKLDGWTIEDLYGMDEADQEEVRQEIRKLPKKRKK